MGVSIKTPNPKKWIEQINTNLRRTMAREIEFAKSELISRTQSGLDANDAPFAPYSDEYRKQRAKGGRSEAPVDLTYSGQLMQAIQSKVEVGAEGVTGVIYITPGRGDGKSNADIARGLSKLRKFFAFGARIRRTLIENVRKGIKQK